MRRGDLEKLAALACTVEEAASVLGVSKRTLLRRLDQTAYKRAWEDGLNKGNVSLRRLQWAKAQTNGPSSVTMLIHLSKYRLGQTDKVRLEVLGQGDSPPEVPSPSRELTYDEVIAELEKRGLPTTIFDDE